jgi:MFS family permease
MATGKLKSLSKFPKVFWVVQTFEMMERGAYYTMVPILAYHVVFNVGAPPWLGGLIFAFMYPFQYGLPIFTGALAEKIGYRKQMIFAFSFLTLAYFFLFTAFNTVTIILAVMAVGIGIGSYKPLVSATVAKCTSSEDRNLAYGIYYWVVNLAASVFPIMFVIVMWAGLITESTYNIVFLVGGVMVSINIFTAIFVFKEVPRSGKVKTVGDAVNNIKLALSDKKFVVMVVLIGGFWAQYATMLFAIQIIGFGYHWFPSFITAMVLGIPNPLTIIALGPFISKFIEKIESMRVILGGLTVYIVGLIILGFSLQNWGLVIFGIIVCSIGEFMVAPGYLAFISKLAPKENISAYIGCNFISYMIGLLGGSIVFGLIVAYVGVDLGMPYFFYGILISFALMLFFAFIIYYRTWGQDVIERARKIREMEEGVDKGLGVSDDYKEPRMFVIFDHKLTTVVPLLLIPVVLFGTFSYGTFSYIGPEEEVEEIPFDIDNYLVIEGSSFDFPGDLVEGASDSESIIIEVGEGEYLDEGELLKSITFMLTWEDEGDEGVVGQHQNPPDEFSIMASLDENNTKTDSGSNPQGGEGSLELSFDFTHESAESASGTGEWVVEVTLENVGDFTSPRFSDNSNSYNLLVTTEIYSLE